MQTDKRVKKILIALAISAASAMLVILADGHGWFDRVEWMSQDMRMRVFRSEKPIEQDIAVILVDEASLKAMNHLVGRWPWPRALFADAIDFIALGNPKAIVMDVLFTEDERGQLGGDERVGESSAAFGAVVHSMQLLIDVPDEKNKNLLDMPMPESFTSRFALDAEVDDYARANFRSVGVTLPNNFYIPVPLVQEGAAEVGAVDFDPDPDGVFRRTSLVRAYQDKFYPVLSVTPVTLGNRKVRIGQGVYNIGGVDVPVDPEGRYQVNFCGKYGEYSMSGILASAQKVLRGDVENLLIDPAEFTGKTVFIGSSAVGVEDVKSSPLDPKTPGVFIHASILSNIETGDFLRHAPQWFGMFMVICLSVAVSLIVLHDPHLFVQVGAPLAIWAAYIGACFFTFGRNMVIPLVAPSVGLWISSVTAFVSYGVTEGKSRRAVRKMFSLYVSPEVLNEIVENYEKQEDVGKGADEYVTILFSDIRSFTNISEKLSAQRVVEMLNIYFTDMVESIFVYGGTVDKFIGDAIMCFWGAPIRKPDHELAGVRCAIDMIERLKKVNEELKEKGFDPIAIGVGLNTGHVVLGNIGSEKKLNYTVIGDSVNLASRLEGVTKTYGSEIIISEFTYEGVKDHIPCAVVDVVKVKGKAEPIRLYRPLVGSAPTPEETEKARALAAEIETAFQFYLDRRFGEAMEIYERLPAAKSITGMIERCLAYMVEPPPGDWDGVVTMKTK